jgi:hypothetical protein
MNLDDPSLGGEMYLLEALTTSYRFECIMCRLLRRGRWGVRSEDMRKWAQGRFRAATIELDTILKKVLMYGIIRKMPTTLYVFSQCPIAIVSISNLALTVSPPSQPS